MPWNYPEEYIKQPSGFLIRFLINLIVFLLPGFIFILFATAHSPRVSIFFCKFYMWFLCVIFLHITYSSANSQILMNSLIQTTTLEPTPEATSFISSRSRGTKSKTLEKSNIIASILKPLYKGSAVSRHTVTI